MPGPVETSVEVVIGNGSLAFSSGRQSVGQLSFRYVDPPNIASVEPNHGRLQGGTVVTITGNNFVTGSTECLFGPAPSALTVYAGVRANATVINSTMATCIAPSLPASATFSPTQDEGTVMVRASTNGGVDYGHTGGQYYYLMPPKLQGMEPTTGQETGGTRLRVQVVGTSSLFQV